MIGNRLFQRTGWLAVLALAITSCAQEDIMDGRHMDRDAIAFGVVAGGTDTKTMPDCVLPSDDTPVRLLAKGGTDTLYLHPSVERNLAVPSAKQVATKGVPIIDTENFQKQCKSFGVTAYAKDDGKLFMSDVEVVGKYANGIWSPNGGTRYWPSDDAVLEFYAYAPYAALETPTCEDASLSFSYTTPTSGTDEKKDAEAQPDIMFAYQACKRSATNEQGVVPLNFEHALAGVKFVANDIAGSTIKTITLKNLYGQGECTYTAPAENEENGTFTWETSGDKKDFCQTFDVEVKENPGQKQDITDVNPETTFMMIPQSLEGVEVEITLTTTEDKKDFTLIGSLAQAGEWEAGKIYTYSISTESINWIYVFEVTDKVTFALGETQKTYEVTSYRYRNVDPNAKEAVAWTAKNISFSETDSEKGEVSGITLDKILREFTYQGNGLAGDAASYPIEVSETTLRTTYRGDATLKENSLKGSKESPYDLSTHDENGNAIAQTTANCYVVNSGGTYMLPLVYGNAIKGGGENNAAYSGGRFNDYLDGTITNSRITGADDAVLVWSDGFYMFKDIHLNDTKDYLVFTIDKDYMQQANAVLAVRDAEDRIMWSWHIWVTDHKIYSSSYQHVLDDFFDPNNTYVLMGCNLGWVDEKMVYYNQRELNFQFTQDKSGNVKEMPVLQEGATFDYKDVGSTYYQWGRKDPLVALRNWDKYGPDDYRLHETGEPEYVYKTETGGPSISLGDAIQHPNVFYTRGGGSNDGQNWCNENVTTLWNTQDNGGNINSTVSVKTIYDPSPRGFKVPMPRAFAVLVNGSIGDGNDQSNPASVGSLNGDVYTDAGAPYNKYRVFPKKNRGGTAMPFTATGQRADKDGLEVYKRDDGLGRTGGLWALYGVYYWTCVPVNASAGYTLVIRNDYGASNEVYSYKFNGTKTMARPVRCILDR